MNPPVTYYENFLPPTEAFDAYQVLRKEIEWRQDTIHLFGKSISIPRLHQWFGPGPYTYSGVTLDPQPWPAELFRIKGKVEEIVGLEFNSCLANLYRNGGDSVGWHADNEPEFGTNPVIASVSLGASRDFQIRLMTGPGKKHTYHLSSGSLIVMGEGCQKHWLHCLPKRSRVKEPRINLTFRPFEES